MNSTTRNEIMRRAGHRCEYCRLPQSAVDASFHVDHIIARQHLDDTLDMPAHCALACDRCNLYKGTNLSSIDPQTGQIVELFNPRTDVWEDHFQFNKAIVVGLTPTGRATVRLLMMNARHRVIIRELLLLEGFDLAG